MKNKHSHKIKRNRNIYTRRSYVPSTGGVLASILIITILFAFGWFIYDPVYRLIAGDYSSNKEPIPPTESSPSKEGQTVVDENPISDDSTPPQDDSSINGMYLSSVFTLESDLDSLDNQSINSVMIDMKNDVGNILYNTSNQQAHEYEIVTNDTQTATEIADTIKSKGFKPVAVVSAFKDSSAISISGDMLVKYNNTDIAWIDKDLESGGKTWLNPYSELAQQYILDILQELFESGFQQVILTNVQFPKGYSMELATYPESNGISKQQVLSDFVKKANQIALDNNGMLYTDTNITNCLGLENIIYDHANPLDILGDNILINTSPSLMGEKLQSMDVSIPNPMSTPFDTTDKVLKAIDIKDKNIIVGIQGYTDNKYKDSSNHLEYGQTEINQQIDAITENGLTDYVIYSTINLSDESAVPN